MRPTRRRRPDNGVSATAGRRLASALAGLALVVASSSAQAPAGNPELNEPARLALETDRIIDRLAVPPPDLRLTRWTREILPWFAVEGLVRMERAPASVRYVDFGGAQGNLLLGTASCHDGVVSISGRYANPVSSTYRSADLVFTLAHELAHVQQNGICERAPSAKVETAAQLMALEVTAAMALDGNAWAGLALLHELRDLAVGKLRYEAERHRPNAERLLRRVVDAIYSPTEQARAAQRTLQWDRAPQRRVELLLEYAVDPYRKLAAAIRNDLVVTGVATPITHTRPWASRPLDGSIVVDDLARFRDLAPTLYRAATD